MDPDLQLEGPTVTLFGARDELDEALGDELARRGCSTHTITVAMGWLPSTSHAIFRLGTPTGDHAMHDLATSGAATTRVVAVCETHGDATWTDQIEETWATTSAHHESSLIWHEPFDPLRSTVDDLAATIADEIFSPSAIVD